MNMNMKIVYFFCSADNCEKLHQVSYLPDTPMKEIESDLVHSFGGEIQIVEYEYY